MKSTPSISNVLDSIKQIELDLKNNWSKWGDVSDWVREDTIKKLRRIRRVLSTPLRIDLFSKRKPKVKT